MITKINEIQAKTVLSKTGITSCDYVVNPYNGCQFACMYCYAAQIARWKHSGEEWGSFLDVKLNAPELLKKDLEKLEKKFNSKNFGIIWFSSVTDPYTSLEAKYQITRQCLQVLIDFGYEGRVAIQTKSPLVTRDIDLLKQLKNSSVEFTITTFDDKVSRFLEVEAPLVSARIGAIKKLIATGIYTFAFIGPILPHFIKNKDEINKLLDTLQNAGVTEVWFEHLHLVGPVKTRLMNYLETNAPDLVADFQKADTAEYRNELSSVIYECLKGRNLKLGLGKIIYHRDLPKKIHKMKLINKHIFEIIPLAPFNFDATFHKPAHFASGDNHWQPGVRWQTFRFLDIPVGVKFVNRGSVENPIINIEIYSRKKLLKKYIKLFTDEITYRYNLNLDLSDFYNKFASDLALGPIITKWRGLKPGHQDSLYEYLVIGLMLQNCTVKRSVQMMQTLFEKYGTLLEFDNQKLWCFWLPGGLVNITEEEIRSLKIGYRTKALKKIDGVFSQKLIDENDLRSKNLKAQKEELLKLYGVGPATVWYLLFDVFHHYDFFDHISPWEQKIYSKLFFNIDPETPVTVDKIIKLFKKYHPYEQLAVHYVWEDLWWKRKNESIPWLEKLIRV